MRPFVLEETCNINESMRRERRWHYPTEALREAVVNVLAHRDWTRYEEIELIRYVDRVEILSPGAWPNNMTIKKCWPVNVRIGILSSSRSCEIRAASTREPWAFARKLFLCFVI